MKNILIICYSPLHRDPRVLTQYNALKDQFSITLGGFSSIPGHKTKFIKLRKPIKTTSEKIFYYLFSFFGFSSFLFWTRSIEHNFNLLSNLNNIDTIIANDLDILPIAIKLKKAKTYLIFDAHEYYPSSGQAVGIKRRLKQKHNSFLLKACLKSVDKMVTVAPNIRNLYKDKFGKDSIVIMNFPELSDLNETEIDPENIKIVHHGAALPNRKLELMIETMNHLGSNYSLAFYLVVSENWQKYYDFLVTKAVNSKANITFHSPVDTREIPTELNKYDIGFFLLPPINLNYLNALPNKLFEFIQSRLAIVIGPSPEMRRIVEKYDIGIVGEDFDPKHIAKKIMSKKLNELILFKSNCNKASSELNSVHSRNQWFQLARR